MSHSHECLKTKRAHNLPRSLFQTLFLVSLPRWCYFDKVGDLTVILSQPDNQGARCKRRSGAWCQLAGTKNVLQERLQERREKRVKRRGKGVRAEVPERSL
jgi:hypothetical protein